MNTLSVDDDDDVISAVADCALLSSNEGGIGANKVRNL